MPNPHLPDRIPFFRKDLEVFLSQLHGGQRLQLQVGPCLEELHQVLEGVQTQTVVSIVGQVCHENADLEYRINLIKHLVIRKTMLK